MRVVDRRREVARMYVGGMTQQAIANHFDINRSTISRDLDVVHGWWLKAAIASIDEVKAKELQKIDWIEQESIEAWQLSKRGQTKKRTKAIKQNTAKAEITPVEQTIESLSSTGDMQYLRMVSWCVEQRLKIFGVYAAVKHQVEMNWRETLPPKATAIADDFFNAAVAELAAELTKEDVMV